MKKNLVLLGLMAVGKTTIGKIVAKAQLKEFIDTDENVEKNNNTTIFEMFKTKGESFFRAEEEKEVLKSLKKKNCIIALGGGAFINETLRKAILKDTISIWLNVDIKTINKRIKWGHERPLLDKKSNLKEIEKIYNERKNIYKLANYKIECNDLSKEDIVNKIIDIYEKH